MSKQIKKAIEAKQEELRALPQLSPAWEAKCAEIRKLRAELGNPLASIKPGVYFTGKGAGRTPFLVA